MTPRFWTKLSVGFLLGIALYGCGPEKPIRTWSKMSKSPNDNEIARARLGAVSGFGTAFDWINVAVMIKRFPWTTVISFSIDRLAIGPDSVKSKWIDNSHLDVRYCYKINKVFFHIKNINSIIITLHREPSCMVNTQTRSE